MKNIEINIKQSDGTYEVLYPKVNAVSSNISTEVGQQFGLENGSIDDVLKYLGKFNEYWYYKQGFDTLGGIELKPETHKGWLYCNNGITYSKNITYNSIGDAYLIDPTDVSFVNTTANQTYVDEQMAIFLSNLPCYILAWTTTSNVTVDDLKVYYVPEGATYSFEQDNSKTFFCDHSGTNIWNIAVSGDSQASIKPCDLKVNPIEFPIEYYQSIENNLPENIIEYYGTIQGKYSSNTIGDRYNNIKYSNEIEVVNGEVKLKEPISIYSVYNDMSGYGVLKYKFIESQYSSLIGIYYCQRVTKRGTSSSDFAITANVIPVSIYSKGYKYYSLGIPFEKLLACTQYSIGSYIGTGGVGESNKNSLTFGFVPKLVYINSVKSTTISGSYEIGRMDKEFCWNNSVPDWYSFIGSGSAAVDTYKAMLDGKTLYWWTSIQQKTDVSWQMNSSTLVYAYVAFG